MIGIDPGTGRCGYAVMEFVGSKPTIITYGCLEYPKTMELPERLVNIEANISELIAKYKPQLMAVETLLFNKNITTAMQVAEARGVITLCAAKQKIPIQNCSPLQVKMAVTGYGRADKKQVLEMVKRQLNLREAHKLDDAIDALAIAITGFHLAQTTRRLTQ